MDEKMLQRIEKLLQLNYKLHELHGERLEKLEKYLEKQLPGKVETK